ncbi:hypothetical protein [Mammaliicoccus lentus]|uniref:hypothetical protein n=1 Tax=Mammaliicoccus lentus TaxID=42858 RepID=UPI0024A7F187|nr:hypothetical protein [Mammaliicoccus lentus]WHI53736.1 hypothetical protein PYH59_07715 [Mammaliicoccus lentus]WHI56324.1 hypothetical protein PYH49_07720 [Mammaliicoccus lentus]WHI64171.1 hypothetical protein PYH50_07725 [Mammaliicoccus lentus]WHI85065.1 hypothetical protein PYH60_07730 [Mammaliicoccus lentus]WHI89572.1 hypothetical protein PYH61_07720 [Mammaliicoccus lentus]
MILFNELSWYEQCNYKMEYFIKEIEYLKQKDVLNMYDQIRINTLLNIIKSPMEYATFALTQTVGKQKNAYIPFRKPYMDDKNYKKEINKKFGYVDETIFNIYNKLFESDVYEQFNDMHNNEKHTSINDHVEYISENTGVMNLPGNINIGNNTIKRPKDGESKGVVLYGEELDLTQNKGYSYDEEIYFEYNNREVFEFLDEVFNLVNNFVVDIKEYIDNKERRM